MIDDVQALTLAAIIAPTNERRKFFPHQDLTNKKFSFSQQLYG